MTISEYTPAPTFPRSRSPAPKKVAIFEIPLKGGTPSFQTVSLGGTRYQLYVHWCDPLGTWVLDLGDQLGNPLVNGIPMVTGADLLAQYRYLGFGGALVAQSDFDWTAPPTFMNLGQTGHLYWIPYAAAPLPATVYPASPQDWRNPALPTEPAPAPT
jgi:hypothetical protein